MADTQTRIVITAQDNTAAGLASVAQRVGQLGGAFTGLASPITAATAAVAASAATMGASLKAAIDTGDNLNKLSQKTGIAVEQLSALAYAGDLSGVAIDALATGIKKLSVNMSEAAAGTTGKASEAFRLLNVNVKDTNGNIRGSEAVLADIADKFAGMEDGAGKTALAVALFGKAGADLIPLLNQGSAGLADMTDEAKKLGLVMSGETAKAAEEFNDNMARLSSTVTALGRSLAADLVAPAAKFLGIVVDLKKEGAGLFGALAAAIDTPSDTASLADLRDRAAALQNRISRNPASNPQVAARVGGIFSASLEKDRAELVRLQRIIQQRMRDVENFDPNGPFVAGEKTKAPALGTGDGAKKESAYLAGLRQQLTAATGDVTEYSKQLEYLNSGSGKEFSESTRKQALELSKQIDVLRQNTKAREQYEQVTRKVAEADDKAAKAVTDFADRQAQGLDDIQSRIDALGKTPVEARQIESARAIQKAYEEAVKKVNEDLGKIGDIEGITARTGELQRIRDKALSDNAIAIEKEKAAQDALNASWEHGASEGLRKYSEEVRNLAGTVEDGLVRSFKSAEDALVDFVTTGRLNFSNFADSVISSLARIQVQKRIMDPLVGTKESPGILTEGLNAIFSSFGGARAAGGPVQTGRTYLVGEQGPELFTPSASGTILPNASLSGGGSPQITVNVIEDTSRAGQVQQRNSNGESMLDVFVAQIRSVVAGDIAAGRGPIPAAMESTYGANRAAGAY